MKIKNKKRRLVVLPLILLLCLFLTGCQGIKATDLTKDVKASSDVTGKETTEEFAKAQMDFAVRLLQNGGSEEQNTLLSPVSAMLALSMVANGAQGVTLAEMEAVLGMPVGELNEFLYYYVNHLPDGRKYRVNLGNSIWINTGRGLTIKQDFLQTNADYYGAQIYETNFSDAQALEDVNRWLSKQTDKMLEDAVEKLNTDAVMMLLNALSFEAEWENVYAKSDVHEGEFTSLKGEIQKATFLSGEEGCYFSMENGRGFAKDYKKSGYQFIALIPEEGVSLSDFLAGLTGEQLFETLKNGQKASVEVSLPKFSCEYEADLKEALQKMGMVVAFEGGAADFNCLGRLVDGRLHIENMVQMTTLTVDEKGTRGGAASKIEMEMDSASMYRVSLNRPFLYMVVDTENHIPLFIGTVVDLK
ncbi:MAG: serpin family protein [Lachnospiraceae bacterium]|nr:serpin family protein [Lachnospiraceae bacterium]